MSGLLPDPDMGRFLTGYGSDIASLATITGDARFTNLANLQDGNTGTPSSDGSTGAPADHVLTFAATRGLNKLAMTSSSANPTRMPSAFSVIVGGVTVYSTSGITWAGAQETRTFTWDIEASGTAWTIRATAMQNSKWEFAEINVYEGTWT
jgi:hypothetical protein